MHGENEDNRDAEEDGEDGPPNQQTPAGVRIESGVFGDLAALARVPPQRCGDETGDGHATRVQDASRPRIRIASEHPRHERKECDYEQQSEVEPEERVVIAPDI